MKLRPFFVDEMPEFDAIEIGDIWISHKLRTINLRCPCGSGRLIVLTIQPGRWHVHFDGKSVSLKGPTGGSVWANSCCGGHYKIRNNSVIWLDRIDSDRHSAYAKIRVGPNGQLNVSTSDTLVHGSDAYGVVSRSGSGGRY